jgi:hypothetical protein
MPLPKNYKFARIDQRVRVREKNIILMAKLKFGLGTAFKRQQQECA